MKSEILPGSGVGWDELEKRLLALDGVTVQTGYITDKKHPDSDLTVGEIATIQQYGSITRNIPERPFMTDGGVIASDPLRKIMHKVLHDYLIKGKGLAAFKPVQKVSKESIEKAIHSQKFTPLAPATLRKRRAEGNNSTTILIDSAFMINNIETKIIKE